MDLGFPEITETWRADAFEMTYRSVLKNLKGLVASMQFC